MRFSKVAAISLSLFAMSLAGQVSATELSHTVTAMEPQLSVAQPNLKQEVKTLGYLQRVTAELSPYLTGICNKETGVFTRTQWNNSCNARYNLYDASQAGYQAVTYKGIMAGFLGKTPVFVIDADMVDAMMLKGADEKDNVKPFIVLTSGLVNTLADNPVGLEFILQHELGHATYNHDPSPVGAIDPASLSNTRHIEMQADAFALNHLQTKYSATQIKEGLESLSEQMQEDFSTLPPSVQAPMKSLYAERMNTMYMVLKAPSGLAMDQ